MSHTKEPWIYELPDADHEGIIIGRHGGAVVDGEFSEANARRIVACVNACRGIPTENLEKGNASSDKYIGAVIGTLCVELEELKQQRNELLAALEKITSPTQSDGLLWWQIESREALAKVGAGATAPEGHNV